METTIVSFLPIFIMQAIYAVFAAQIAKRTNKNVPLYVIVSLIPFIGTFFFIYIIWSTVLWALDSINELRAQKERSA
ncbi:hypothetical protein EGT07_18225 [Herbaspirillum sp. HC18]|nr:hypothetical protein EGT07_18225 [Herbaspirillum sp. HC18]